MMGNLSKAGLALLCLLFLSACNIEVVTLGKGRIHVVSDNAVPCPANTQCLDGGYNRLIELQAEPAEGYAFAGWSGDCRGAENCTVRTLGSKTVIAVFKSQSFIEPLMDYTDEFFFSGPWPTDLKLRTDGRIDLSHYPFRNTLFEQAIKRDTGRMQGFARNDAIYIPIASDLPDFNGFEINQYDDVYYDNFQLVNLSPESTDYLHTVTLQANLYRDHRLEKDSLLRLKPAGGFNLDAATTYGVIVYSGEIFGAQQHIHRGSAMSRITQGEAPVILQNHWQQISHYVNEHTARSADDVAAFSVFTTQAESDNINKVRQFLHAQAGNSDATEIRSISMLTYNCHSNPDRNRYSELFELIVRFPFFLQGEPPFLLSGGKLNLNANGKLVESNDGTIARIIVSVPCDDAAPEDGYPVEISAIGTGVELGTLQGYDLLDQQNHGAIKFYIAAPYTRERIYDGGLANLQWVEDLLGIDTDLIAIGLGDFNPLNWGSIEPQYLQYAADIIHTYQIAERLQQDAAAGLIEAYPLNQLQIDPDNLSFGGTSLGAMAAVNASTLYQKNKNLSTVSMPRPNVQHMNNVVDGLLKEYLNDNSLAALEWVLGIELPMNLNDPILSVLQTAIDPIDTANHLPYMEDKNILMVMPALDDELHGGEPTYDFARAIDLRFGINPLQEYESDIYQNAYPLSRYVNSHTYLYSDQITGQPIQLITSDQDSRNAIEVFTSQMASGEFSALPQGYWY